jgi:Ser/Thr protein kinase RdoA (MazF antagonist)
MVEVAPRLTAQSAIAVARLWHAAAREPVPIRSGESSTWGIEFASRRWILRLTSEAHRSRDQLEAELDFVDHLAAGGLDVARALDSLAGPRVVDASQLVEGDGRTYAVVFERLEGRHFE